MATTNSTRRTAASSLSAQTDEFAALSRRLLITINQVMLVSQHFGDLTSLSPDDVPAGLTLDQAAKDLDRLYNELDSWEVRHEHRMKASAGLRAFTDDRPERIPLPDLPHAWPCPFCGRHDDIMVSQTQEAGHPHGPWFRASCGYCGVDAPGGETLLEAAQGWNTRADSAPRGVGTAPTVEAGSAAAASELPASGASDKTADRIRAFLASVRPWDDFHVDARFHRGRALIDRMAMIATDTETPTLELSAAQCADVIQFLHHVEPFEPLTWWKDPEDAPSHLCGLSLVMQVLENNLRKEPGDAT